MDEQELVQKGSRGEQFLVFVKFDFVMFSFCQIICLLFCLYFRNLLIIFCLEVLYIFIYIFFNKRLSDFFFVIILLFYFKNQWVLRKYFMSKILFFYFVFKCLIVLYNLFILVKIDNVQSKFFLFQYFLWEFY